MPLSPSDVTRNKPSQASIISLIDKGIKRSNKMTLHGAPFLIVDAPVGYVDYKDAIVTAYTTAGWARVEFVQGDHRVDDKIHFYTSDADENATPVNAGPSVSFSAESSTVNAGGNVKLFADAMDADGVKLMEIFVDGLLLVSATVQSFTHIWENIPQGTYSLTLKATDNADNFTVSDPVTVTAQVPVPAVTSFTSSVFAGQDVNVLGSNLSGVTSVRVALQSGFTSYQPVIINDRELRFTVSDSGNTEDLLAQLVLIYDNNAQPVIVNGSLVLAATPTIDVITPTSGQVGQTISVFGNALQYITGISFGYATSYADVTYTIVNNNQISFTVVDTGMLYNEIVLKYGASFQITAPQGFSVVPPVIIPDVSSISTGQISIGDTLLLNGSNLSAVTQVLLGAFGTYISYPFTIVNDGQISFTIPDTYTGTQFIRLIYGVGGLVYVPYAVQIQPAVDLFQPQVFTYPDSAYADDTITITGVNLDRITSVYGMTNLVVIDSSTIVCQVPPQPDGTTTIYLLLYYNNDSVSIYGGSFGYLGIRPIPTQPLNLLDMQISGNQGDITISTDYTIGANLRMELALGSDDFLDYTDFTLTQSPYTFANFIGDNILYQHGLGAADYSLSVRLNKDGQLSNVFVAQFTVDTQLNIVPYGPTT